VLGVMAQGCGVMSSSSDCSQRANCDTPSGPDATNPDDGDVEAGNPPTGDEGNDVADDRGAGIDSSADVGDAAEDMTLADADATGGEAGRDADAAIDVVSERDARIEGSIPDAIADVPPLGDGCATTENCTNGIDDNCDGKIDCADPTCTGYSCAMAVPAGWSGPALLWTGTFGTPAPSCPSGYTPSLDANQGPSGSPDTCTCTCTPSGQLCQTTGSFMINMNCTGNCATVSPAGDGSCTTVPSNSCGNAGSFAATAPTLTGGTCASQVTITPGTAASWTTTARVCLKNASDAPGGCGGTGEQCVLTPSTSGFVARPCIYQAGTPACPAAYPNSNLVYSSETDARGCSPCACGAPTGGTCSGTISLYGSNAGLCGGTPGGTFTFGDMACNGANPPTTLGRTYSGLNNTPGSVKGNFTVTPGTCPVTTPSSPTGGVTPTGATTICCM
jgi:hypothetical protein